MKRTAVAAVLALTLAALGAVGCGSSQSLPPVDGGGGAAAGKSGSAGGAAGTAGGGAGHAGGGGAGGDSDAGVD